MQISHKWSFYSKINASLVGLILLLVGGFASANELPMRTSVGLNTAAVMNNAIQNAHPNSYIAPANTQFLGTQYSHPYTYAYWHHHRCCHYHHCCYHRYHHHHWWHIHFHHGHFYHGDD